MNIAVAARAGVRVANPTDEPIAPLLRLRVTYEWWFPQGLDGKAGWRTRFRTT